MIAFRDVNKPRVDSARDRRAMEDDVSVAIVFLLSMPAFSQSLNYQGALRSADGERMSNTEIDIRVSLYAQGVKVFEEEHLNLMTSEGGIFHVRIGSLDPAAFQNIDFGSDIEVMTEIRYEDDYEMINYENLAAVPLALHAKTVDNTDDADADPQNEIQQLTYDGNQLQLSRGGGSVRLPEILDTDRQSLSLVGSKIVIERGNSIDLQPLLDAIGGGDTSNTNEIQRLALSGTELRISGSNTVDLTAIQDGVEDADADSTNEIQRLALAGTKLRISRSNTVDLAPLRDGVDDAGCRQHQRDPAADLAGNRSSRFQVQIKWIYPVFGTV